MFALFKRELKTYFRTPAGYIFTAFFMLITGIFFSRQNLVTGNPRFAPLLSNIVFIFLLVVPILTMRLMTDEKRMNTDKLLFTSPLRISEIVLGKYLAAVTFFIVTLLVTILYPILLSFYGAIDVWETVGAYVGFFFLGSSFIALGLFVSTATENQLVAAILTFFALLLVWIMSFIKSTVPTSIISGFIFANMLAIGFAILVYFSLHNSLISLITGSVLIAGVLFIFLLKRNIYVGFIGKVLGWLSPVERYDDFALGILNIHSIVYYVSFSTFFLFLTGRLIDKKRWS